MHRSIPFLSALVLVCQFAPALAEQSADLAGRWLFSISSGSDGRRLPLFIAEIEKAGDGYQARVVNSNSGLEFEVPRLAFGGQGFVLEIQAKKGKISFQGRLQSDGLIEGRANGGGFQGREFLAERTRIQSIAAPRPPSRQQAREYQRAQALKDPLERAAALNEFIQNNSQSSLKLSAYELILRAHLEAQSDDEELVRVAEAYGLNHPDRTQALDRVAMLLAENDRMLEWAEKYSQAVLQAVGDEPPPKYLKTRGRIAHKRGRHEEAVTYLERALKAQPGNSQTAHYLAEAKAALGRSDEALQLYLDSYLESGSVPARGRLERFYSELKGGSLDGLEETIDQAYSARPLPFEAGEYDGPAPLRRVLVELFTGSECVPCQASDLAFDGILEHYPSGSITALQYHLHIPRPDPLTNVHSTSRADYYNVRSTPVIRVGGTSGKVGGGKRNRSGGFFREYKNLVEKHLYRTPRAQVRIQASRQGDRLSFQVQAETTAPAQQSPLSLRIALTEGQVRYSGRNGIRFHRRVVRHMVPDHQGVSLSEDPQGEAQGGFQGILDIGLLEKSLSEYMVNFRKRFGVEFPQSAAEIDRQRLFLVAFVQNDRTKEVLASAEVDLSRSSPDAN